MEIKFLSSVFLMFTLAVAAAPPPSSSVVSPRPSPTPRKYRDSKISRIQPYVLADSQTAPAINSYNSLHSEKDSTIKYYHANKFLEKNHGHKKFGFDKKKVSSSASASSSPSSNHELFKSLGLAKIKTPPGHHRKRLAVESSRHHSRPDDSHMFIIKLPPNPYYYANTNTAQNKNGIEEKNQKISSMGFKSNGKPGRIYHWNLPVLKKMLTKGESTGRKSSNLRHSNDVNDLIDIKNIPTWSNPWDDNETLDKAFSGKQHRGNNVDVNASHSTVHINGIDDDLNLKLLKKKSPTYYAPAKQKKKATQHHDSGAAVAKSTSDKYFPGNGKPKSFYVIKKNDHKPYYQKLIP